MKFNEITFEEVSEQEIFSEYSAGCSGGRSDCCTRTCGKIGVSEEEWGKFLEVEGGVIQY